MVCKPCIDSPLHYFEHFSKSALQYQSASRLATQHLRPIVSIQSLPSSVQYDKNIFQFVSVDDCGLLIDWTASLLDTAVDDYYCDVRLSSTASTFSRVQDDDNLCGALYRCVLAPVPNHSSMSIMSKNGGEVVVVSKIGGNYSTVQNFKRELRHLYFIDGKEIEWSAEHHDVEVDYYSSVTSIAVQNKNSVGKNCAPNSDDSFSFLVGRFDGTIDLFNSHFQAPLVSWNILNSKIMYGIVKGNDNDISFKSSAIILLKWLPYYSINSMFFVIDSLGYLLLFDLCKSMVRPVCVEILDTGILELSECCVDLSFVDSERSGSGRFEIYVMYSEASTYRIRQISDDFVLALESAIGVAVPLQWPLNAVTSQMASFVKSP